MFSQDAHCDASTISEMLGSEEGVTNKNILQYMGIIEQRTMELLQIQQYIQMKVWVGQKKFYLLIYGEKIQIKGRGGGGEKKKL